MFCYQLILSYDGTRYFGWQKTKTGPSIQETLEKALTDIGEIGPPPEAASRTDRGVHARGQSVAILLIKKWDEKTLQKALNHSLPLDIRIVHVKAKAIDFHPTLEALEKEYHYDCCLTRVQQPIYRRYSWHVYQPVFLDKIEQGAKQLLGTHDFTAFTNAPKQNAICTLREISLSPLPEKRLRISISGDRFLYNMARNIVGTLLAIGHKKFSPEEISLILTSRDRKKAGMTAPAHGLVLHRVVYRANELNFESREV